MILLALAVLAMVILALFIYISPAQAAITNYIPLSGRLMTDDYLNVADGNYTVHFRFYDALTGGSLLWEESKTVTVKRGIFSTNLGETTAFTGIDWNSSSLFLAIQVGTDAEMIPRKRILPTALAINADQLEGMEPSSTGGISKILHTNSSGNLSLGTGTLTANTITSAANQTIGNTSYITTVQGASLTLTGATTITGNTSITGTLTTTGNILPGLAGINLGSATNHWATLYADDLQVGTSNTSGTTSSSFSVNTDAADNESSLFRYYLGPTLNTYSALRWDGANQKFDLYSREDTTTYADLYLAGIKSADTQSITINPGTTGDLIITLDTAGSIIDINDTANTTQTAIDITNTALTSGTAASISQSTSAFIGKLLNLQASGGGSGTGYGVYSSLTGAATTNVAGYFSAANATNNYGLIVENGNVGIGTATPGSLLTVGNSAFTVTSAGVVAGGTYNKVTITPPAAGSTLTIADTKTLTVSDSAILSTNSLTFAGTEILTLAAAKNVTFADSFATSGAFALTLTTTGATNATFPTTGTLATLAEAESFTNKTGYNGLVITPNTGAVTTGTWTATSVAAQYGGTGQSVYVIGDLLYASSTTALSKLADVAVGSVLVSGGVGAAPAWSAAPSVTSLTLAGALSGATTGAFSDTLTLSKATGTGLAVTSNATIGGTLTVSGASTSLTALTTSGAATLNSLGVTNAATVGATLGVTGAATLTSDLTVNGNTVLGNISTDTLTITASLSSNFIPGTDNSYDLGASNKRFANFYAANAVFDQLSTPNTTAPDFVINSDNATADLEDSTLQFERGSVTPNAIIGWNATSDYLYANLAWLMQGNTTLGDAATDTTAIRGAATLSDSSSTYKLLFGTATQPGLWRDSANTLALDADLLHYKIAAADAGTTTRDSRQALLQGAYWNGVASVDVTGSILLDVRDTTPTYGLALQVNSATKIFINQAGQVGIGTTVPGSLLEIGDGTDSVQFSTVGDITFVDANGAASITGPAGGALTISAGASQALTLTGNAASVWSVTSGGLTVNATSAALALQTTTSGNITLIPASTGSVQLTSGVTTGTGASSGFSLVANSLSSGTGLDVSVNSTAAASNTQKGLNISLQGANATTTQTTYGLYVANIHTGTSSTNVAGYFSASGGTNNYGLIVETGNVGIGDASPAALFTVGSGDLFQVASTGLIVNSPTTTGTLLDYNLETEWTTGTLLNADFGSATSLSGNLTGLALNFNTNLTPGAGRTITGFNLQTPALTQTDTSTSTYTGYQISAAGALVQNTAAGTITWRGLDIQMPSITQTTGTVSATGIRITGGTVTSGTSYGLIIDANAGNVGIGTTGPGQKLDVNGYIVADGIYVNRADQTDNLFYYSSGTGKIAFQGNVTNGMRFTSNSSGGSITFQTNGANDRLFIKSDGNVGIGTTGPSSLLSVGSTSQFQVNSSGAIAAVVGITNSGGYTQSGTSANTFTGTPTFSNATYSALFTGGNLGIGTTGPTSLLHAVQPVATTGSPTALTVAGGAHTTLTLSTEATDINFNLARTVQFATGALATQRAIQISAPTYGFVGASTLTDATTLAISGAPVKGTNATLTNTYALKIAAGAVSTATNSYGLYVDAPTGATNNYGAVFASGNVGIGTTAPDDKLHIVSAANTALYAKFDTTTTGYNAGFRLAEADAERWYLFNSGGDSDKLIIQSETGPWANRFVIQQDGNVGIGTTGPGAKLDVAGDIEISATSTEKVMSTGFQRVGNDGIYWIPSSALQWKYGATGASGDRFTLTSGGRFGIRDTSPSASMEIVKFSTDDLLMLSTSGTATGDLLVVKNSGKVGIGTTSPTSLLSVGSTSQFQVDSSGAIAAVVGITNSGGYTQSGTTANTFTGTPTFSNATYSALFTGGNLGIGTTGPARLVDIQKSNAGATTELSVRNPATTDTSSHAVIWTGTEAGGGDPYFTLNLQGVANWQIGANRSANRLDIGRGSALTGFGTGRYMSIDSSGNVGIGTTGPSSLLSVGSTSQFQVNSSGAIAAVVGITNSGGYTQSGTTANTFTGTPTFSNATYSALFTGGNLGIGTTGPSSKLDVTTASLGTTQTTSSGLALVNTTAAALNAQQISPAIRWSGFGWKTDVTAASQAVDFRSYVVPVQGAANPTGYLSFGSSVNGAAYSDGQMVLTSAGNVGIGTTGPRSKLEVAGAGTLRIANTNADPTWNGWVISQNSSANLDFSYPGATSNVLYLKYDDGKVGIGTTSPTSLLSVGSTSQFQVDSSGAIAAVVGITNSGGYTQSGTTANTFTGTPTFSNATYSALFTGGNLGIGTTGPGSKLEVLGTATFGAAGVSSLNATAHTVTLSGANPTTYATFRATAIGAMTLAGTNPNQTVTTASSLYVATPVAGTNVTITNNKPIDTESGAYLSSAGVWTDTSGSEFKQNFAALDFSEVLTKIGQLPIESWNYKTEGLAIRHIGPVAEDFYQIFGVGNDDKHLAALDTSGVALAGIKGLLARVETLENQKIQSTGPEKLLYDDSKIRLALEKQQGQIDLIIERVDKLEPGLKGLEEKVAGLADLKPATTPMVTQDKDYQVTAEDEYIRCDAGKNEVIISLPQLSAVLGQRFTIKKIDESSNYCPVKGFEKEEQKDGETAETVKTVEMIEGQPLYLLLTKWQYVTLISTESGWEIVGSE